VNTKVGSIRTQHLATILGLLLLTSSSVRGQFTWGDWQYSINGNNAIITRYTGRDSDVSIPSAVNGLPVQYLDIGAFSGRTSLTNVLIPSTVYGVLNGLGVVPFDSCINLLAINVDPQSPSFSSIDGVLFNKKQTSVLEYPQGRAGGYTIPTGVLRVSAYAFDGCTNLNSVTIPSSVTNILNQAFHGCSGLSFITIPGSVKAIGAFAFTGCDYMTNVFFAGNPPVVWDGPVFSPDWVILPKTMYYCPEATGWGATYAGYATAPLNLTISDQKRQADHYSFRLSGPAGVPIMVESAATLDSANWTLLQSGCLTLGTLNINDGTSDGARFYRIRLLN
jgi:Leucine Rich Repeat (LRR) protein